MYGDQQAQMTMNRAAYGDVPAAMMSGGGFYGGAAQGMGNMMSDIGGMVMPNSYSPPARFHAGYYGMYQQHTGMMRDMAAIVGIANVPRGTSASEYYQNVGIDLGSRLGGAMVGGGMAAAGIGVAALMAPVVGAAGRAAGLAAGSGIGGLIGMGEMGGTAGAAIGGFIGSTLLPFAATAAVGGAVMSAVGQRRDIQSFLESSSFRFVGPGGGMSDPITGSGMSRDARGQTTEFMRQSSNRDRVMDMGDMTKVLEQGTQLGLFNGTRDMGDFQQKFKDITEAVKNVTKTLHQTLEEGLKTIKDLKGIGVDPSQASSLISSADILGKMSGRTAAETLGLGLQGADIFRGTGVNMGVGAQAAMMNVAAIRSARDAGTLSQEAIAQAGGEEALALRQTAGGLAFSQSAFGRGTTAAFLQGGQFSQGAFGSNVMAGGGSFVGQAMAAAGNLSSPAAVIAYQANQSKIMSEMGKTFGGNGLEVAGNAAAASYGTMMSHTTGASFADSFKLSLMQLEGINTTDADVRIAKIRNASGQFKDAQAATGAIEQKAQIEEAHQNRWSNRAYAQVKNFVNSGIDMIARPAGNLISDMEGGVASFAERQFSGVQRVDASNIGMSIKLKGGGAGTPINLDKDGVFASTAGTSALDALQANGGALAKSLGLDVTVGGRATSNTITLKDHAGILTTVDKAAFESKAQEVRTMGMTEGQAKKMQEEGALKGVKGGLWDAVAAGRITGNETYDQLAMKAFGHTKLTAAETAKMTLEATGSQKKVITAQMEGAHAIENALDAVGLTKLQDEAGTFNTAVTSLGKKLNLTLAGQDGGDVAMMIAKAREDPAHAKEWQQKATILAAKQNKGVDMQVIRKNIDMASRLGSPELDAISSSGNAVQEARRSRGANSLSAGIDIALNNSDVNAKTRSNIEMLSAQLAKPTDAAHFMQLVNLNKADLNSMGEFGSSIVKEAATLKSLSPSEAEKHHDEYLANRSLATGVVTAAGNNPNSTGNNAQQEATVQMNMNQATLAAMQAIATKLGGGK